MEDAATIEAQLGRPPRGAARVVVRCPHGRPAVVEQDSYLAGGEPFPTTYYVTCRWLVAAISRLEAAGGVERWSAAAASDPALAASLELGIGGSSRGGSLKCLHAHAAFGLARPGYALGDAILAELGPLWPDSCCTG